MEDRPMTSSKDKIPIRPHRPVIGLDELPPSFRGVFKDSDVNLGSSAIPTKKQEDDSKSISMSDSIPPVREETAVHTDEKSMTNQREHPQKPRERKRSNTKDESPSEVIFPVTLKTNDLWDEFLDMCEIESRFGRNVRRGGNAKTIAIDNDIIETLRYYSVNRSSVSAMVNAILRCFILRYKNEIKRYKSDDLSKTIF